MSEHVLRISPDTHMIDVSIVNSMTCPRLDVLLTFLYDKGHTVQARSGQIAYIATIKLEDTYAVDNITHRIHTFTIGRYVRWGQDHTQNTHFDNEADKERRGCT